MPTFTAIALDRLLEPGPSKSVDKSVPSSKLSNPKPPNSKLERRSSTSTTEKKVSRPQISPALYATPEATPIPDSPSSFPPSPYIVNHKRRGPCLLKSFSQDDISSRKKTLIEEKAYESIKDGERNGATLTKSTSLTYSRPQPYEEEHGNSVHDIIIPSNHVNGVHGPVEKGNLGANDSELVSSNVELGSSNRGLGSNGKSNGLAKENGKPKLVAVSIDRDIESEDFYDPQESLSVTSNAEGDDNSGAESSLRLATPIGEFYDAWEELSSESGLQSSLRDIEAELREMRLSLVMEIEKRKQAEESLDDIRSHWQRIRQQLANLGISLPADPTAVVDSEQLDIDPAEQLSQKLHIARFVSDSIGRGIMKAELEMEMEAQIESKNFEIARLSDRLHYYEAVNREMSQRNQEAIEMARRDRQRRKRIQRWVWGSIAATITLGTAALAWSYLPSGKSSSTIGSQAPENDDSADC